MQLLPLNLKVGGLQTQERPHCQPLATLPNITVPSAQGTKLSSNRWSDCQEAVLSVSTFFTLN